MRARILIAFAVGLATVLAIYNWPKKKSEPTQPITIIEEVVQTEVPVAQAVEPTPQPFLQPLSDDSQLPEEVDLMAALFRTYAPLLQLVETIEYKGKVEWLSGRLAYIGDYATHYKTSRHFISRSLNGTGSYLCDIVSKGDRFNVLRTDKEIDFHLVLDLSRLKLWVYAHDQAEDQRILLKSYPVSAGRLDNHRPSGSLTPLGTYAIGNEMGIYSEGDMGNFKMAQKELISVFGKRWISLGREIARCTAPSKGLGLHGVPWKRHPDTGELQENRSCIGTYASGGCIRLLTEDIEEIYSVIVSRPAFIHIVRDFTEAQLPGTLLPGNQLVF